MSKWIKCSKEMPPYGELVLYIVKRKIQTGYYLKVDDGGIWISQNMAKRYPCYAVTFWMPLPKFPED